MDAGRHLTRASGLAGLSAAILVLAIALCIPAPAFAQENLLPNGDLAEGNGQAPSHWDRLSLRPDTAAKTFSWVRAPGELGELRITISKTDFARWRQTVKLTPGWYCLSGEIRVEEIDPGTDSAQMGISVEGRDLGWSPDPRRVAGWNRGTLYFKVGESTGDVDIVCQLVGSTGSARCRDIRLVRSSGPAQRGSWAVDLETIHERRPGRELRFKPQPFAKPTGSFWTVIVTVLLLIGTTASGWLALGVPSPAQGASRTAESK